METLRWQVGDATVIRILELDAAAALQGLIPRFDLADIARAQWLTPDFVDEAGRLRGLVQAFLIMIAGQVIIIDPGVGNGKKRTAVPGWDNLHTNFLDRLQGAGVEGCIMARLKSWDFPAARGGKVIVSYPFVFNAVGS